MDTLLKQKVVRIIDERKKLGLDGLIGGLEFVIINFEHTMIVNEYILRYGDFDGFFTKSNVTLLTAASGNVPND